jgi:hypothetical protein
LGNVPEYVAARLAPTGMKIETAGGLISTSFTLLVPSQTTAPNPG